jgi:integrase/recombinase XerD
MTSFNTSNPAAVPVPANYCRIGPLSPYIEGFAAFLAPNGYHPFTLHTKFELASDLSEWLKRRRVPLAEVTEEELKPFYAQRHLGRRRGDSITELQLFRFLREQSCIPAPKIDHSALGRIIQDYERFLSSERGLVHATLAYHRPFVRRFLIAHFGNQPLCLADLRVQDLQRFILQETKRTSMGQVRHTIQVLRSFLRFLLRHGMIKNDLAEALPTSAHWRLSHLPKSLPPDQIRRILACCDRLTPTGRRDHVILLILARLGLRAGEVVAMTLDDLDWENGEILVRGKGLRHDRLPMPQDVGKAIVDYLRYDRPASPTRRLFIRMLAPKCGFMASGAINDLVRRALKRAGLDPKFKGSHLFRHSLATNLLSRGASLREIGGILRHQQLSSTQIYAKVDIKALRCVALPWMGGVQ